MTGGSIKAMNYFLYYENDTCFRYLLLEGLLQTENLSVRKSNKENQNSYGDLYILVIVKERHKIK